MKKFLLLVSILTVAVAFLLARFPETTRSEQQQFQIGEPKFSRAVAFGESSELRDIRNSEKQNGQPTVRELGGPLSQVPTGAAVTHDADAAVATFGGTSMPLPITNFPGIENLDNGAIYQLLIMPADMNGDVGPNHYVQFVNSLLRVYDKTGQAMGPPFKISSLFESLGTVCSTRNDAVGLVQYDQLADRWLVTQTCTAFPPFRQMVAISKTGDPLGGYYAYEFVMPNVKLNDFPKFGVWPD
ncbi:MAG TPA: hypothetical protein VJV05_07290, partial [Pyrinomonadaceae bacterium]|nr:hypothetical protein [Pyrinomonadaceae bacterium]